MRLYLERWLPLVLFLGAFAYIMTATTSPAAAETKERETTETWRKNPPQLPPPPPYKLPPITTYNLDIGLPAQLLENHPVLFLTLNLCITAGSSQEPEGLLGVLSLTADMITEGK